MHRSQARLPSEILQPRLTENWPRHKKWHKMQALQQKELAANTASYAHKEQAARATENLLDTSADTDGSGIAQKMSEVLNISGLEEEMNRLKPGDRQGQKLLQNLKDSVAAESAKRAKRGDTKLGRLALEAQHLHAQGAYDKAAKKLLKRMDEFKDHPDLHILYALLAAIYRDSNDVPRAAESYLKVVGLTQDSLTRQPKAKASNLTTDVEHRERGEQICWARAVTRGWSALCTPACEHMPKPDYLKDGADIRATSALVLRVQSSRAKDEMDNKTDLWDAVTMRAGALAGSKDPDDQIEHRQLIARGRRLASTPEQQAVVTFLEADVATVCQEGIAAVRGVPDTLLKKLQLSRDGVPASGAPPAPPIP